MSEAAWADIQSFTRFVSTTDLFGHLRCDDHRTATRERLREERVRAFLAGPSATPAHRAVFEEALAEFRRT